MRSNYFFTFLSSLFMSFFIGVVGVIFLSLPEHLINQKVVGVIFIALTTFFLLGCTLFSRRRYLLVKMNGMSIAEKLVGHFAKEALQELFPDQTIECEVIVHRKAKVEILAHIPYLSDKRRQAKLEQIETVVCAALLKYCGWKGRLILNVSFA